jgi:hypothetical protein
MTSTEQKRRMARIPVVCPVGIRERASSWITQTMDVGARGCRISLERPLSRGSLVQLVFDRGSGEPLEALGQVAWTRQAPQRTAGIVFVNLPRVRGIQARNWIDALVAARLRQVVAAWPAENGGLARLADVAVHLGLPPTEPLDPTELSLVRLVRDGARVAAMSRSRDALAVLVALLDREILSVFRETPDPEGWKSAFARFANHAAAAQATARPLR